MEMRQANRAPARVKPAASASVALERLDSASYISLYRAVGEPVQWDQRLRMAIQSLGVANRFEAARILAKYEGPAPYQSAVYQSPHVAPAPVPATVDLSDIHGVRQGDNGFHGTAVREEQLAFRTPALVTGSFVNLPFPTPGRERNDLNSLQRLGWIVSIAIASALAFGGLLAGLDALKRLFQA